jgi:hypothetical protein
MQRALSQRRAQFERRSESNRGAQTLKRLGRRSLILISCSLLLVAASACGGSSDGGNGDWQVVMTDLPAGLTGVWGTSATDIWAIGGDSNDAGNTVKHFQGTQWQDMTTGSKGDLWWVYGFPGGSTFFGGANGLILRYKDGQFEAMDTPGDATVYGIWGTSEKDLWAVGGNVGSGAFAWRYDGTSWTNVEGFPPVLVNSQSLFKVWGSSADDVWMVGTEGTILHYDGNRVTQVKSGTTRDLFTVSGREGLAATVGGFGTGVILENDGSGWRDVTPDETPELVGVFVASDTAYAVGIEGAVQQRNSSGEWKPVKTGIKTSLTIHTVWVDPDGGVWAVGGDVLSSPLEDGIMIHKSPQD